MSESRKQAESRKQPESRRTPRRTKSEPRTKARRVAEEEVVSPRVSIVMGSDSDWPTMEPAAAVLKDFGVLFEADVVSAHRMPEQMVEFGRAAHERGIRVIIAGAGGAAHLPGMLAALTPLPVIGVPVPLAHLEGMDSLLSIVQMPGGVPVATVGIGNARNAGLLAVRILAAGDPALTEKMLAFQEDLRASAQAKGGRVRLHGQS
ncbi:5-(carboxyamino)imidazole ribonucleotide mutase [Acidipropionibacterium jensenii]|uniref:N5-carboxyaminoimidazole ribonucleotide mutase n=1 Tax=Acidipropionibacterium jensenii TaxID=1749 RepID=A0A3T0RXY9_9ACTN|nr:5-(carboxyamino)imidazole ribonucleotide mutase [Acidipropionibacterium jensenii]